MPNGPGPHGGHNSSANPELASLLTDWTRAKLDTLGARKRLIQQVRDAYVEATGNASTKQADGLFRCLKLMFEQADAFAERDHREKVVKTATEIQAGPEEQEDPFADYPQDATGALQ